MDLNVASAAKLAPAFLALAMVFHNFLLEKKKERLDWNDLVLAGPFVLHSHSQTAPSLYTAVSSRARGVPPLGGAGQKSLLDGWLRKPDASQVRRLIFTWVPMVRFHSANHLPAF